MPFASLRFSSLRFENFMMFDLGSLEPFIVLLSAALGSLVPCSLVGFHPCWLIGRASFLSFRLFDDWGGQFDDLLAFLVSVGLEYCLFFVCLIISAKWGIACAMTTLETELYFFATPSYICLL